MKAIMISDRPKWCALMMNGIKKIEVRKENVGKAVQKLIDENGYAEIYVYCGKDKEKLVFARLQNDKKRFFCPKYNNKDNLNGKVVFKFRCYKVEEMRPFFHWCIEKETCLTRDEVLDYLDSTKYFGNPKRQGKVYAIHISDLEIFDKPKELSEFDHYLYVRNHNNKKIYYLHSLTKAPQSFMYIESEE